MERDDFKLTGFGERGRGAPDKGGIAIVLDQRGAALSLPAAGLQSQEVLERGGDFLACARDVEPDGAMLGQTVALAAQLLQLLGPQRIAQQFVGVARGVEAGAELPLQHARTQIIPPQHFPESVHGCAIERHVAQDQRMGAGLPRRVQQSRRGLVRPVAVERRRAQRAVGMSAHQRGQRNLEGPHQRNHRQQADQSAGVLAASHRCARTARTHRCGRLQSCPPRVPRTEDSSRSARWRIRTAGAIGSTGQPSAAAGLLQPSSTRDRPRLCRQSRPRPRFPRLRKAAHP